MVFQPSPPESGPRLPYSAVIKTTGVTKHTGSSWLLDSPAICQSPICMSQGSISLFWRCLVLDGKDIELDAVSCQF